MARKYAFDSYALLAFLQDEPGSESVANLIGSDDTEVFMSVVNLGEVFYVLLRERGEAAALELESKVLETPKIRLTQASWERAKAAAKIKAAGGLSFADCFAASLAQELGATLVTGDPELAGLEREGSLSVLWLRGGSGR